MKTRGEGCGGWHGVGYVWQRGSGLVSPSRSSQPQTNKPNRKPLTMRAGYREAMPGCAAARSFRQLLPTTMAKIKTDVAGRSLPQKLEKGQLVITKGTDNPNAPGNEELVAALAEAQVELKAAVAAAGSARLTSIQRTMEQAVAEKKWRARFNALASFTEAVTGGDPTKMLGTGFDVRAEGTPTRSQPELPVVRIIVKLNGTPGHAKLTWDSLPGADGYLVQGSADPKAETSWVAAGITMKTSMSVNGASPGQSYWYRVAAFNSVGEGPWSLPAARPVM